MGTKALPSARSDQHDARPSPAKPANPKPAKASPAKGPHGAMVKTPPRAVAAHMRAKAGNATGCVGERCAHAVSWRKPEQLSCRGLRALEE
eukprot:79121-Chlamydomonas_euryale.AAC.2